MARRSTRDSRWAPYVPVATRVVQAEREKARMAKQGAKLEPVAIAGRNIASTVWGKAWCDHIEGHCDFYNRLPRGRTYVRRGAVIDLKITLGQVIAVVMGSSRYTVRVTIQPLAEQRKAHLQELCAGSIHSLVDLLSGKLSANVMKILCDPQDGLFPRARELSLSCSCPDGASMCKHVAATLYGVGARLDTQPELLFTLRGASHLDLITAVSPATLTGGSGGDVDESDLESLFGIELDAGPSASAPVAAVPDVPASAPTKAKKQDAKAKKPAAAVEPTRAISHGFLTAADLLAKGIPRTTFANWITAGHLKRTKIRGRYQVSQRGSELIAKYAK